MWSVLQLLNSVLVTRVSGDVRRTKPGAWLHSDTTLETPDPTAELSESYEGAFRVGLTGQGDLRAGGRTEAVSRGSKEFSGNAKAIISLGRGVEQAGCNSVQYGASSWWLWLRSAN